VLSGKTPITLIDRLVATSSTGPQKPNFLASDEGALESGSRSQQRGIAAKSS
jgi:hypothetical protein